MFCFSTNRLNHNLTTVPAGLATVELRMTTDVGADGTGRDAHGQRDFSAGFSLLEHFMDDFDILFFHSDSFCNKKKWESSPQRATLPGWVMLRLPLRECR